MGNSFPLRVVPDGVFLYALETKQGEYAKIARAAGSYIYIVNKFTR
jgi:ribosomal protein L2